MSNKLSSQDKLNISVREKLATLSIQERYILTKEIKTKALISLGGSIGAGILFIVLMYSVNRVFYYGLIFSFVGIIKGSIDLINPERAMRTMLSNTIQDNNKGLREDIRLESKKKQRRMGIIWFSFLGAFILFTIITVALAASQNN